tara:strand:- start:475 stop:849 length:375 start_codon:yes stop_codon:yes gene_type:complete
VNSLLLQIPVTPVPASRPRVSKWGTYYGKTYSKFRKEAKPAVEGAYGGEPLRCGLEVHAIFYCKRPKTTKRRDPRGDVDNYVKAILDSCNGIVWDDDDQILRLTASKRWEDEFGSRIELIISPA